MYMWYKILILLTIIFLCVYGIFIEPDTLVVNHYAIQNEQLQNVFINLKSVIEEINRLLAK